MRTQHENRAGIDRRQISYISTSPIGLNRRRTSDQRTHIIDESKVYDSDSKTEVSEDYWETLFEIPSEDCK